MATLPRFPLYIVSKGRADTRLTARTLEWMKLPYHIVVEEQEFDDYAAVIDPRKILVLDKRYRDEYDVFDDEGGFESKGAGAARNFVWDHSIAAGHAWHWVMDDNIERFYRYNDNQKIIAPSGAIFSAMEDFCLRYLNVAMAGPNYFMFISRKEPNIPPFTLNTRIYSCNLIRNDVPFRWRGRFNEDTDLSLRMLKARWATVLFNAFLQRKTPTQQLKGGNTDSIYQNGTYHKSRQQVAMHSDVSRMAWRFGRVHHYVDYSGFKTTRLERKPGIEITPGVDNYGMVLRPAGEKW